MSNIRNLSLIIFLLLFLGCNLNQSKQELPKEPEVAGPEKVTQEIETDTSKTDTIKISEGVDTKLDTTKNVPETANQEQNKKPEAPKRIGPKISFENTIHQFGTIMQGDKVSHTFVFTNTGDVPLNVKNAKASCGCTMPSYPFLPINPGASGKISVTYDSKLKEGQQEAKVTVLTDASAQPTYLFLKGFVEKPAVDEEKESSKKETDTPTKIDSTESQ